MSKHFRDKKKNTQIVFYCFESNSKKDVSFPCVKQILSFNQGHILLTYEGRVYIMGNLKNVCDFGLEMDNVETWTSIPFFETKNIIQIASYYTHFLFLAEDQTVYVCGTNDYGQLVFVFNYFFNNQGIGGSQFEHIDECYEPQILPFNKQIIKLFCNVEQSLIWCKNNECYAFGWNLFGNLGLGHANHVFSPECISYFKYQAEIVDIYQESTYWYFLLKNGQVYTAGKKNFNYYPSLIEVPKGKWFSYLPLFNHHMDQFLKINPSFEYYPKKMKFIDPFVHLLDKNNTLYRKSIEGTNFDLLKNPNQWEAIEWGVDVYMENSKMYVFHFVPTTWSHFMKWTDAIFTFDSI